MTGPVDGGRSRIDAAMEMLGRVVGSANPTGFLARVPWNMRFYVEQFLACGKLGRLREPAALVQNCIVMARKGAALHGDTSPGPDLLALAELFERHAEEAAAYAEKWGGTPSGTQDPRE